MNARINVSVFVAVLRQSDEFCWKLGALSIYEKNPEISVVAKGEFPIGKKLFHLVVNLQGGKTFCASFCAPFIAGSRRAFLCVDFVRQFVCLSLREF